MSLRFGLTDTTLERKIADAEPADPPMPVLKTEPLKGPWTGNNNLGIRQPFAPDANNRQTILKTPEWGFPVVWTVTLGIVGFPQGDFDGFGIKAILEAGVGGCTQTIEIDWRNGTQISLVMNALNVIAEFQNLDTNETTGLELTVEVARGNRPGASGPPVLTLTSAGTTGFATSPFPEGTLMEDVIIPAGGDSGLMRIPELATKILVGAALPTAVNILRLHNQNVRLATITGNTFGATGVLAISGADLVASGGGIPVTGQARYAILFNGSGDPVEVTFWAEIAG